MIAKLKEVIKYISKSRNQNVTLRRRLMLYLSSMILVALGIGAFLLIATGNILSVRKDVGQYLEYQLDVQATAVEEEIEEFTGHGINLSKKLSRVMDNELYNGSLDVAVLNDNQDALGRVQKNLYPELETTIQVGRSSGVFAVLDATINTKIPEAEYSRSGIYLRLANVSSNMILNPEISYFRGMFENARERQIMLHNRWNLECNIQNIPGYDDMLTSTGSLNDSLYWAERIRLEDTWEDVIVLYLPIRGADGSNYGICGIELNATHFNLKYPATSGKYGSMVMALVPVEDGSLLIDKGLLGGTEGTWLQDTERLKIGKGQYYNKYYSDDTNYVGMHKTIKMAGKDGGEWVVAVLIPENGCEREIRHNTWRMLAMVLIFILVMIIISSYLSKKFVNPILDGFKNFQEKGHLSDYSFGISELDNLMDTLKSISAKNYTAGNLPPDVEMLFEEFIQGVHSLTKAEYNIFHYYMDGYQVAEVPDLAYISMSTVKKHNRNIYEKLGISSYDELMLYLDLINRFEKSEELERRQTQEEKDSEE